MRPRSGSLRVTEKVAALGLSVLVIAALLIWSVGGAGPPTAALASTAATTTGAGSGYWLAGADGGVFNFGVAQFDGSGGSLHLRAPIVGMATTPDGGGYWLVASDGGVFTFGDAVFFGSTGGLRLNKPIVGMAATPDGGGYWLVASDGGVFTFGDAVFYGSTGGCDSTSPSSAWRPPPTAAATGWWRPTGDLHLRRRGVPRLDWGFAAQQAHRRHGGHPRWRRLLAGRVRRWGVHLRRRGVPRLDGGFATQQAHRRHGGHPDGDGYWLVASDGGVFTFGDAISGARQAPCPSMPPWWPLQAIKQG